MPKPAAGAALSRLQDLQALRPGHLGGARRVRAAARGRQGEERADRLWRHGGDAEAGAPRRGSARRASPGTRPRSKRRWPRSTKISRRSTTGARAPPTAAWRRATCCGGCSIETTDDDDGDPPGRRPEPRPCLSGLRRSRSWRRAAAAAPRQRLEARQRRGELHRRPARAARTSCTSISASARGRMPGSPGSTSRRCAQAPGVVAGADRRRHSGRQRRQPDASQRRAGASRPRVVEYRRPAAVRGRGAKPRRRRGARRSSPRVEYEDLPAGARRRRRRRQTERLVTDPLTLQRGDADAAIAEAPRRLGRPDRASAARSISTSRARSRWRSRARTTRSRSTARPSTRARSSTWWPQVLGVPTQRRDGRVPAHGRRRSAARRRRPTCSPASRRWCAKKTGRAGQDPARSRRRHGDHRQAPRFRGRLRGRLRRRGPHPRRRHDAVPRAAATRPICRGPVTDRALFHADNCYYLRPRPAALAAAQDQHRVEHRVSRLRRPAGHGRGRAGDRGDRVRAGQGPARDPQAAISTARTSATSRPTTRRSRTTSSTSWWRSSSRRRLLARRREAIRELQRDEPRSSSAASR